MATNQKTRKWKKWSNNYDIDNALYYDPPRDGNCLLSCIREATYPQLDVSIDLLRYYASLQILREDKDYINNVILAYYREEVERKQFAGAWNPMTCKDAEGLAEAIVEPVHSGKGMNFQGDNIILAMLGKILKLDFIVFDDQRRFPDVTRVVGDEKSGHLYTIFLEYQTGGSKHYRALGVENNGGEFVQTLFFTKNLPENFKSYMDKCESHFRHRGDASAPHPPPSNESE
jgi:hypothetical protein